MLPKRVIKNVRVGLATNSSSSHSIIHNENIATMDEGGHVNSDFGWDFFTAKSKKEREVYMMLQLKSNMPRGAHGIIEFILKYEGLADNSDFLEGYIDHDSVISLPREKYYPDAVNMDFFRAYFDYITNNHFVFLGGNDNTDEEHSLSGEDDGKKESFFYGFKDNDIAYENGNYWVVMNNDRKLRIQFEGLAPVAKSPELIDLKITDYCDIGCNFCYQDSTVEGIHGDYDLIHKVVGAIPYGNITEFAIGGGEPTSHPDFAKIVDMIKSKGHIANFTTKSTKWMDNAELLKSVQASVSGIAYSPSTVEDIEMFVKAHDEKVGDNVDLYLHIIPEIWSNGQLNNLLDYVDELNKWNSSRKSRNKIKITMLGFKTTGRGEGREVAKKPELIDYIKNFKYTQVGIDTKIVNDYIDELTAADIDKLLFTGKEGEFSMYIDAVTKQAYKSSYELDKPVALIKDFWGKEKEYYSLTPIDKLFDSIKE